MKIAIGCDHAGFEYKQRIREFLERGGHEVRDHGTHSNEACDFPTYIYPVARAVANGDADRGIVLGGSGNGEAMAANRIRGIRAGVCWDLRSARLARAHNDANILSMGQRMLSIEAALEIVSLWLSTEFDGGRHERRIALIDELA